MRYQESSQRVVGLIAALAVIFGCAGPQSQPEVTSTYESAPPAPMPDTLVTAEWLAEHLDDPDLVVLDCTVTVKQGENGSWSRAAGPSMTPATSRPQDSRI